MILFEASTTEVGTLIWELLQAIGVKIGVEGAAAIVAIPLLALLRRAWVRWNGTTNKARLARARKAIAGDGLWLTQPINPPAEYKGNILGSIPIITLANLKGGVGKTSITANLAAYFVEQGESVLVIDLDFQGSLSSMILGVQRESFRPQGTTLSKASAALSGGKDAAWLLANAWPMPSHPKLFALTTFYDLARTENKLQVEWLIRDVNDDMPYSLAKLLLDPIVQARYDRILIDAPPRLSTACIQALCASKYVLIPTVLDGLSTEAATTFLAELDNLKQGKVCPNIEVLGIVGSMINPQSPAHEPFVKSLKDSIKQKGWSVTLLPEKTWIPDMPAMTKAAGLRI